jgi:hypothetical protein
MQSGRCTSAFQRNALRATSGPKSKPKQQRRNIGNHLTDYTAWYPLISTLHELLILVWLNAGKFALVCLVQNQLTW